MLPVVVVPVSVVKTSNFELGLVVPIPTLPELSILTRSVLVSPEPESRVEKAKYRPC